MKLLPLREKEAAKEKAVTLLLTPHGKQTVKQLIG